MTSTLQPWQRRVLAVALALFAIAAIWMVVMRPALALVERHRTWRENSLEALVRYRAFERRHDAFVKTLKEVESDPLWPRLFASGDTAAAAAQLQSEVKSLYDPQAVTVQLLQPLEPVVDNGITRVGVRLGIATSIDQLAALLERVHSAPHLVRPGEISISSPQTQEPERNPQLIARIDLWGYLDPRTGTP